MKTAPRRCAASGFTLIELLISLVAGLIVALAVVALSKEASNTFHEEMRASVAEMSLRTAIDRLRADLQRVSYMGTGNVRTDPFIAHAPGAPNIAAGSPAGLLRLSGVLLRGGGSAAGTPLSGTNGLNPDAIELSGNFTTTDSFVVSNMVAGGGCNGQRLWLSMDTPAMWRVRAAASPDDTLRLLFQPVANTQFYLRVEDDTGHFQYVPTCAGVTAGVIGAGAAATAFVDVPSGSPVLTASQTRTVGGATGFAVGRLTVNPVQTVRWDLRTLPKATNASYGSLDTDPNKYNLVREFEDATGTLVPTNVAPVELVAEYAVDLRFAFSVDNGDTTGTNPQLLSFAFGDAQNQNWALDISANPASRPQRIRAIRVRLSTRTANADRLQQLTLPNSGFPVRYCTSAPDCNTANKQVWARLRTVTTEVALQNQSRFFY